MQAIFVHVSLPQHDYPPECRPGGANGNYIMFASATSGDRPNNSKFSTCSVGNISNVLDAIEDNKKRNCFKASAGAFCGNKIVEAGEECDCGEILYWILKYIYTLML